MIHGMTTTTKLHPATAIGAVTLKVSNLVQSLQFYTKVVGLKQHGTTADGVAWLGDGVTPLLRLREVPGAKPPPESNTGLYHVAILLPTRCDLARVVRHFVELQQPIGYSDHLVSEAFYLSDPDGSGLEIYRDRPRAEWPRLDDGHIKMANAPIDFDSLFAEITPDIPDWQTVPSGTKIGHMHLKIGDLKQAQRFYCDLLGFDLVTTYPGALFVSAGGYHHHLGLNIWHSRGGSPAPENATGLEQFDLLLPSDEERERVVHRLREATVDVEQSADDLIVYDPWCNRIALTVNASADHL